MYTTATTAPRKGLSTFEAWRNALAFIQSCYATRVRDYDLDAAMAALAQLTDEEYREILRMAGIVASPGIPLP